MKNVEDVKLEMKIGKKKVFKKELSSREWKDLKNHGQIGYSYEYKNTGKLHDDYTDGKIIIKIKYYNKELKKNVEEQLKKCGLYYRLFSRVKDNESLAQKLNSGEYGDGEEDKKVQDLLGIRVVLYYSDDLAACRYIL